MCLHAISLNVGQAQTRADALTAITAARVEAQEKQSAALAQVEEREEQQMESMRTEIKRWADLCEFRYVYWRCVCWCW